MAFRVTSLSSSSSSSSTPLPVSFTKEDEKADASFTNSPEMSGSYGCQFSESVDRGSPLRVPSQPPVVISPYRGMRLVTCPMPISPSKMDYPKAKPSWYNDAHRLARTLSQINQDEPLGQSDIRKMSEIAHRVIAQNDPTQSLLFLKILSEFTFFGAKGIFFKVLQPLRQLCPEIAPYFVDIEVDDPEEGPGFTNEALDKIFRFFETEFKYPANLLSTQPISSLPALIGQMLECVEGTMRGWLMWNDELNLDPHRVPVFAIKKDGKVHMFLFDSLGHESSQSSSSRSIRFPLQKLIDHFGEEADVSQRLVIYSYRHKRQNSDLGCSTFGVLDLKNLLERHLKGAGNIVDFYASQLPEMQPRLITQELVPCSSLPIYEINTLPPEMMKVTQSCKFIERYGTTPPRDSFVPNVERYSESWGSYEKRCDLEEMYRGTSRSYRTNERDVVKNLYVDQKRLKFIVYLLGLHVACSPCLDSTVVTPSSARRSLSFSEV